MTRSKPYKNWRRPVAFFLGTLFLFTSIGYTLYTHYCPFKGASISFSAEKTCCCSAGDNAANNCCKNKSFQVKIEEKYQEIKGLDVQFAKAGFTPPPYEIVEEIVPLANIDSKWLHNSNSSPPKYSIQIFLFIRSILI